MARALGGEPKRIPKHLGEIVVHEPRLVFVDREAGVMLARGELEPHTSLGDAVALDELADLLVQTELRILQIDRINRVR